MNRVYVMQLVRSFQVGVLTRRQFLKRASVALGSLAAANTLLTACAQSPTQSPPPVVDEGASAAEPEQTAAGLITGTVDYPDPDGETLMGYLARPDDDESRPAVIVIQEWWGLNEHIKDVTRRVAEQGYVALAPDLYHGVVTTEPDEARKQVMELDMAEAVKEIQLAIDFLQGQDYVSGEQVGVVGFCMGGGLVLQTALAEEDVAAGVVFYGRPLDPAAAGSVNGAILGLYGEADQGIPVEAVEAMHQAFSEAGIENEYQVYESAPHAFFNDTRDSYRPEAAADAWERMLGWFETYLGA